MGVGQDWTCEAPRLLPLSSGSLSTKHTFPSAPGHLAPWAQCPLAVTSASVRGVLEEPALQLRQGVGGCMQSLTPPTSVPTPAPERAGGFCAPLDIPEIGRQLSPGGAGTK